MAITKLPTDYVDAVTSQKKYMVTDDGFYKNVTDVSTYSTQGSAFNSRQINQTNNIINSVNDLVQSNLDYNDNILDGTQKVAKATYADTAPSYNSKVFNFDISIDKVTTDTSEIYWKSSYNSKITSDSLAEVYFDSDSFAKAKVISPTVQTTNGYLYIYFPYVPATEDLPLTATVQVRNI